MNTKRSFKKSKKKSLPPKVTAIPQSLIFFFFLILGLTAVLVNDYLKINQKILGLKSQIKEEQRLAYDWEKILEEKPDYRDGWLHLAVIYADLGNKPTAQEALSRAKALDPQNSTILSFEKLLQE